MKSIRNWFMYGVVTIVSFLLLAFLSNITWFVWWLSYVLAATWLIGIAGLLALPIAGLYRQWRTRQPYNRIYLAMVLLVTAGYAILALLILDAVVYVCKPNEYLTAWQCSVEPISIFAASVMIPIGSFLIVAVSYMVLKIIRRINH